MTSFPKPLFARRATVLLARPEELLTENINTATPSGKLTFHVFAALADYAERVVMQSHSTKVALWLAC
jgi:hypothetical protein